MLSLTSVSASEDDIGYVADEFMLPCQRVHAMTVLQSIVKKKLLLVDLLMNLDI